MAARRRHRRRIHLRRAGALVILGLLVALGVLLFVRVTRTSGPAQPPPAAAAAAPRLRPGPAAPARPIYGTALAPAGRRVAFRVQLPLRSGLLFDVGTGAVLWADQPRRVLAIASLTKMMTALVVVAHSRPTDRVLITPAAVHFSGSGIGLLPQGAYVPELALLYGLLLPSGNDAAIALAQHVAGNQPRFVALMNRQARQMGLGCTRFASVSGIVDRGNHSCASDLAILTHAVLANRLLATIVGTRDAIVPFPIKGGKLYLYNNNPLLRLGYPGTDGVKTGFTDAAGRCLVVTVRRRRTWLGLVLLHSADPATQAENLLNAAFAKLGS